MHHLGTFEKVQPQWQVLYLFFWDCTTTSQVVLQGKNDFQRTQTSLCAWKRCVHGGFILLKVAC